jgi:hypothetical protein
VITISLFSNSMRVLPLGGNRRGDDCGCQGRALTAWLPPARVTSAKAMER